jgi:hypothetical protein
MAMTFPLPYGNFNFLDESEFDRILYKHLEPFIFNKNLDVFETTGKLLFNQR